MKPVSFAIIFTAASLTSECEVDQYPSQAELREDANKAFKKQGGAEYGIVAEWEYTGPALLRNTCSSASYILANSNEPGQLYKADFSECVRGDSEAVVGKIIPLVMAPPKR